MIIADTSPCATGLAGGVYHAGRRSGAANVVASRNRVTRNHVTPLTISADRVDCLSYMFRRSCQKCAHCPRPTWRVNPMAGYRTPALLELRPNRECVVCLDPVAILVACVLLVAMLTMMQLMLELLLTAFSYAGVVAHDAGR